MNSRLIDKIDGTDIWLDESIPGRPRIWWISDADIDCDGPNGNPDNDPYWQPETTLRNHDGSYLDGYKDKFIVVMNAIIQAVPEVVMGCQARVTYLDNGLVTDAVVGDKGPTKKTGELSCLCADAVEMNPNPNNGGEDDKRGVLYECWPGQAGVVDGKSYPLQHS